jgi:hypothetical protein
MPLVQARSKFGSAPKYRLVEMFKPVVKRTSLFLRGLYSQQFHFLCNLPIGPIRKSLCFWQALLV